MKRLFILATAAIVALASCSKTQVVYNDAPEEIGFKTYAGAMTKAEKTLTAAGYSSMGVFANHTPAHTSYTVPAGVNAYDSYFSNVKFVEKTGYWGGATAQYWPITGELDFVAYAPHDETEPTIVNRTYSSSENTLTISVDNSDIANQVDWLYIDQMLAHESKNDEAMSINFRHALAMITVNVSTDLVGLKVSALTVKDTEQIETLTMDYAETKDSDYVDGDSNLSWTETADNTVDMQVLAAPFIASDSDKEDSGYCLVIPSAQTSITLTYTLPNSDHQMEYTHTLPASNWVSGYHYTYDFTIGINEIKFTPTVTDWETGTGDDPEL